MNKRDKYTVIQDEADNNLYIVLADKTNFKNEFNNHKYINNKKKRNILVHTIKRNWKEISQASLDNIQLPNGTKSFSDLDYKELIFNFRTITGQTISIPLTHGKDADINLIVSENFNPSFFRTNFPKGLIGSYLADFVTVVLYELYKNANIIDSLLESAILPADFITVDGVNCHFNVANIQHNKIDLIVTDDEENPVMLDENYVHITRDIKIGFYEYIIDEYGERINDIPTNHKEILAYNINNNKISLLFEDNSFILTENKKVLIIEITHEETTINLIRFLSMNIEKQGLIGKLRDDWTVSIPLINAIPESTVNLTATITDEEGLTHNGNIRFYLEGGE